MVHRVADNRFCLLSIYFLFFLSPRITLITFRGLIIIIIIFFLIEKKEIEMYVHAHACVFSVWYGRYVGVFRVILYLVSSC